MAGYGLLFSLNMPSSHQAKLILRQTYSSTFARLPSPPSTSIPWSLPQDFSCLLVDFCLPVLAVAKTCKMTPNNSFKPTPLRGAA